MQARERNPRFSNPLINSSSPYLRQHAHNPVFWYPWGKEAIDRAREENKPILLSVGYSTCYWCHVMERDVFENLSIASLMNKFFINIKVDREEHPDIDELYMIARQMLTKEGGWPNTVFLTPDLKPFYAGGTYGANELGEKPAFPRLLETLNYHWTTDQKAVRKQADEFAELMKQFATQKAPQSAQKLDVAAQAQSLFKSLEEFHDGNSGGFFQAPKFPQENYLNFLLAYFEQAGETKALDIVANTLGKMAAGGIFDHVSPSFHRYAIDKEWYIPHFEKMLYNQALLARLYTKTAVATKSLYFKDVACGVLDFVAGPMTSGEGAFYTAIDAETDGIEGDYYTWTPQELEELLQPEEVNFLMQFYALADVPAFAGHKHTDGKVLIARKPLPMAAQEADMPYEQLAALSGTLMNKLLEARNKRHAPGLDNKFITSWNGLMIAAYAEAAKAFDQPRYFAAAQRAADFVLEHGFNDDGELMRIIGSAQPIAATLEDYAFLIQGLIALQDADPDEDRLETIESLAEAAEELFADNENGGWFLSQRNEYQLYRMKGGDDSSIPSGVAVMLQNFAALYRLTQNDEYREKAEALQQFYLLENDRPLPEFATMLQGALELHAVVSDKPISLPKEYKGQAKTQWPAAPDDVMEVTARWASDDYQPGDQAEVITTIKLADGWHINAFNVAPPLIRTQLQVFGKGFKPQEITYPTVIERNGQMLYEETVHIKVSGQIAEDAKKIPKLKVLLACQPCSNDGCHRAQNISLTV